MKIIVLLFASLFGFGLATKEAVKVKQPVKEVVVENTSAHQVEEPVRSVLLDTVEVVFSSQDVVAGI